MNIKTVKLSISGMTCDGCATGIEKKFETKQGIISKQVSYPEKNGFFEFDADKISKDEIIETINSTGHYKVEKEINEPAKIETVGFEISGMTCDGCARTIDNKFQNIEGVLEREISYPKARGSFTFNPELISKSKIKELINSTIHYQVVNEIPEKNTASSYQYDLIIIGGGSAAFSAAIRANELGKKTLMINGGLPIGGTCVNVGCVPSKYLIRAAESVHKANHSPFRGIKTQAAEINFKEIIEQKTDLVRELQQKKYLNILDDLPLVKTLRGFASFKNTHTVLVDNTEYSAANFLIATGSSNNIPDIQGINEIKYLTNESLFELKDLPDSMIILGGSYVALEIAQAFHRFGTKITLIQRSSQILSAQDEDVAQELTEHLSREGIKIYTGTKLEFVKQDNELVKVNFQHQGKSTSVRAQKLLLALGTKPNTDKLNAGAINLKLTEKNYIDTNLNLQTSVANIYAAGDCINTPAYVYTAAYEGKTAINNMFGESNMQVNYDSLPWVVFTDPQVAGVGMDEKQAQKAGINYETSKIYLKDVPRSIAAFDTRGFIKLLRDKNTGRLIGARIVAPEGGELSMEISLAIKYNISPKELGDFLHPYLTLSEGLKLAAISFGKDVDKLSCCAS